MDFTFLQVSSSVRLCCTVQSGFHSYFSRVDSSPVTTNPQRSPVLTLAPPSLFHICSSPQVLSPEPWDE